MCNVDLDGDKWQQKITHLLHPKFWKLLRSSNQVAIAHFKTCVAQDKGSRSIQEVIDACRLCPDGAYKMVATAMDGIEAGFMMG